MRDLQIGASALINFQRAMDVTAHNIANAATQGIAASGRNSKAWKASALGVPTTETERPFVQ